MINSGSRYGSSETNNMQMNMRIIINIKTSISVPRFLTRLNILYDNLYINKTVSKETVLFAYFSTSSIIPPNAGTLTSIIYGLLLRLTRTAWHF